MFVYECASAQDAKKQMDMERLYIADKSGLEPLHGLGDDAYVTGLRGGSADFCMRRGKSYICVSTRNRVLAKKIGREVAGFLAQN